jgi:hypothetical protein
MKTAVCGCTFEDGIRLYNCGNHRIAADGYDTATKVIVQTPGATPVVVAKLSDDPDGLRASLGGNSDAFYITYRGERERILHLLESVTAALRKAP